MYINYAFEKDQNLNIMCWKKVAPSSYQCKYDATDTGLFNIILMGIGGTDYEAVISQLILYTNKLHALPCKYTHSTWGYDKTCVIKTTAISFYLKTNSSYLNNSSWNYSDWLVNIYTNNSTGKLHFLQSET